MIKVFKATDNDFTSNGEKIIKPLSAVITKNQEEEYLELEAPLSYAEFLIQDNILVVDTLTGKKGYSIFNPIVTDIVVVKAWLCYQEHPPSPADRGVVIAYGKNLDGCKKDENWDNVVTTLIPVGYNGIMLPEGSLSIPSPYQKVYTKQLEFELTESLEDEVNAYEESITTYEDLVASLENSVTVLNSKIPAYDGALTEKQNQKVDLQQQLDDLKAITDPTDTQLKEIAVIEAELPMLDDQITSFNNDLTTAQNTLTQVQTDLDNAKAGLNTLNTEYKNLIINDLRTQAQAYLDVNKFPQINYDLEAHLDGIVEVGDTVKVKHPGMKVDLLTNVIQYKWDCITQKFAQVMFGTKAPTLKSKISEVEDKIDKTKEDTEKLSDSITKYRSEYKRDNKELVSSFFSDVYGSVDGVFKQIEKNSSVLRQTAAEISATVTRNYIDLDGKVAENTSLISQTAGQIRLEVSQTLTGYSTTEQMNSAISQSASNINLSVSQMLTEYSKTSEMNAAISLSASNITASVNQTLSNYSTTSQMNSAISMSANSITSSVSATYLSKSSASDTYATKTSVSTVEQTANKISWLINSGTSASDFTLTDRVASLVATAINITGYVTFANLSTAGQTTISGSNITTGTIDASRASITNINASNIITGNLSASRISGGTLNFNLITVSNLSANSITSGTLDCSRITVSNLSANSITSGALDVNYIKVNDYLVMNQGSYSNSIRLGGTSYQYVNYVDIGATTFSVLSTYAKLCASTSYLGFFGGSGSQKQSVSTISTASTLYTAIEKLNELINAFKQYNLV